MGTKRAEENARHFMVEILAGQGITFGGVRKRGEVLCRLAVDIRPCKPYVGLRDQPGPNVAGLTRWWLRQARGEERNDEKEAFPCSSRKLARSRATCGRAADLG